MRVGVIGNKKGIPELTIFRVLKEVISEDDEIISGGARDTDNNSIEFAIKNGNPFKIFHPNGNVYTTEKEFREYVIPHQDDEYTSEEYFARNGDVARESEKLECFIKRKRWRGGTWNTISQYLDSGKFLLFIYDEEGRPWMSNELPKWVLQKILKNQNLALEKLIIPKKRKKKMKKGEKEEVNR
jgi:hypothetical protein